jgi:hypothetical protein
MALPTTAAEVELALEVFRAHQANTVDMIRLLFPWQSLFDQLWGNMWPRPHTDDMVQMLDDLKIDLPPPPPDKLTFTWPR